MPEPFRQSLAGESWTLDAVGDLSAVPSHLKLRRVPARVPGCVHTDLLRLGIIPDPAIGQNESAVQWIGVTDWEYRTIFAPDARAVAHDRVDLVFDGLDTIAAVALNGREIARTANMFHPQRVSVRELLRPGDNELSVRFAAPVRYIREQAAALGPRPVNGDWDPFVFARKAACNFGWDWGPRLATCGVWRDVRLEAWSTVRIRHVRPIISRRAEPWPVEICVDLEWDRENKGADAARAIASRIEIVDRGTTKAGESFRIDPGTGTISRTYLLDQAAPWWPKGHGRPNLHDLIVTIGEDGSAPTAQWIGRFGLRHARLNTNADEIGSKFQIEINGRPIFCIGANWIPEGLYPAELTRDHYERRLRHGVQLAHLNTVRVWGGGFYESPHFYDLCDELGILVWQDFMFACGMYPEEPPFPSLVEAEARHVVADLCKHPSVVLWCGGNECVWGHESWGWKDRLLPGQSWGENYYHTLLPTILAEVDPARPYWANSPWSGSAWLAPNDERCGDRHTWDVSLDGYRAVVPRFCSEFGHQSPSNYATLARVIEPEELRADSRALVHRQRGPGGMTKQYTEPIAANFREPTTFEEWHYLAQTLQARAISTGIEWLRANQPRCMGALVWQLNDAWPGLSWSLVDSDGRLKPAWYASRRSSAPRALTVQPIGPGPACVLMNDTDERWDALVELSRQDFDGSVLAQATVPISVRARSVSVPTPLAPLLGAPADPTREYLAARTSSKRAHWFFAPDRELRYPPARFEHSLRTRGFTHALRVTAHTLLRDLTFGIDRLSPNAVAVHQGVTLSPGESRTFLFLSRQPLDPEHLLTTPVMQCANFFGAVSHDPTAR